MKQAQAVLNNLIASNGNECLGQCLDMTLSADAGLRYPFLQAMTTILKQSTITNLTLRRQKSDISSRPFTKVGVRAFGAYMRLTETVSLTDASSERCKQRAK